MMPRLKAFLLLPPVAILLRVLRSPSGDSASLFSSAFPAVSPPVAFVRPPSSAASRRRHDVPIRARAPSVPARASSVFLSAAASEDDDGQLLTEIKSMRVRELKAELESSGISTKDAFEKEELVKRLFDARKAGGAGVGGGTTTAGTKPPAPTGGARPAGATAGSGPGGVGTTRVPLAFYSLEDFRTVDATDRSEVYIRPSPGKFAALRADLPGGSDGLTLLVDTACSGVVLRPSAVERVGLRTVNVPASMTTAAGTSGDTKVAQLDGFEVGGNSFGPMPVAVQDIGALPTPLDGIIGLSFLNQFQRVDIDFRNGMLVLDRTDDADDVPSARNELDVVAEGPMRMTKLGIYLVDATLDGRGPLKMLVDTGAASTLLNWRGISDMGLSRESPLVRRNVDAIGAVGADNAALRLTHRYVLRHEFDVVGGRRDGAPGGTGGLGLTNGASVNVDVGDIPVLDVLRDEGVGGILGADLFMRCDVARFRWGTNPKMTLLRAPDADDVSFASAAETVAVADEEASTVDHATDQDVSPSEPRKRKTRTQDEVTSTVSGETKSVVTHEKETVGNDDGEVQISDPSLNQPKKKKKKKRRSYD